MLNLCWDSIFFDSLITNISRTVTQNPLNHTIFWKSVMTNFKCKYVYCFKRQGFLPEVSTKYYFRTITQGRNIETRQMTSFFSSAFCARTVCNIYFCISKHSKFIFKIHFLGSILVCKISQFWAKATNSDSPLCFSRK